MKFFKKTRRQNFNLLLKIGIFCAGLIFILLHLINGGKFYKIWSYLTTLVVPFMPDLIRKLKLNPSFGLETQYYIFVIITMVIGIDFDLYKAGVGFDKAAHFISGWFFMLVAREIVNRHLKDSPNILKYLIVLSVVALSAVMWEIFEFSYDQIFDGRMQQLVSTGLDDTMWDMIMAMSGGALGLFLLAVLTNEC